MLPTEDQRELADSLGVAKTTADQALNDAKARAFGEAGGNGADAYTAALPDDGGAPGAVAEPKDIERFDAALFTWRGGSNYTDDPRVVVQRRVGDGWTDYADQSGEVPVTVRFPRADDDSVPDYAQGSFEWQWTATFEAFVAPFDTGDRGRATPPGEYRFVVDGRHRKGGAAADYRVVSRTFTVAPWSGIKATDLRIEDDGTLSADVAPVDYPDSYTQEGMARFIKLDPTTIGGERYCFTCTFRPWLDTGVVDSVHVTITRADGTKDVVAAHLVDGRWRTDARLAAGESATVPAGGALDPWANRNGAASNVVSLPAAPVVVAPEPTVTVGPADPTSTPTPSPTSTPSPAPTGTPSPVPSRTPAPSSAPQRCSQVIRGTMRRDVLRGTDGSERIIGRGRQRPALRRPRPGLPRRRPRPRLRPRGRWQRRDARGAGPRPAVRPRQRPRHGRLRPGPRRRHRRPP